MTDTNSMPVTGINDSFRSLLAKLAIKSGKYTFAIDKDRGELFINNMNIAKENKNCEILSGWFDVDRTLSIFHSNVTKMTEYKCNQSAFLSIDFALDILPPESSFQISYSREHARIVLNTPSGRTIGMALKFNNQTEENRKELIEKAALVTAFHYFEHPEETCHSILCT